MTKKLLITLLIVFCYLGVCFAGSIPPSSGGGGTWGSITGTLSNQADLNTELSSKASANPNVSAHTADATITAAEMQRGFITNTGAAGTVNLTLPACTSTVHSAVFYVTATKAIKIIPDTGSQIMGLTSAVNHSITSDTTVGTFVGLTCLASGKWYMTGLNGSWPDTN